MKYFLVVIGLAFVLGVCSANAQLPATRSNSIAPPIPPLPPPDLSLAEPVETAGPIATISFAGASAVKVQSKRGSFSLVALGPNEAVQIDLRFSPDLAKTPLSAQSLDGGRISAKTKGAMISSDGTASIGFQAGDQPGLYRVVITGGGASSILKFWVADPRNPKATPPVVNPR
jgi:hypothetical protein